MFERITLFVRSILIIIIFISSSVLLYGQVTTGLVAWYPFNGNSNDETGNGWNATGSNVTLCPDRFDEADKAYNFDGSSSSIDYGNVPIPIDNFSVSLWIYNRGTSSGLSEVLLNAAGDRGFNIYLNEVEGTITFLTVQSTSVGNSVTVPFGDNPYQTWRHIVAISEGDNIKIFVDGSLQASQQGPIPTQSNEKLFSGYDNTIGYYYFDGKLDDIRVYNKVLIQSEISELYHENGWPLNQGLIAYYPFNGDANDFSENGNNGTSNGGVTWGIDRFDNPGKAAQFNGIDGYIEVPNSVSLQSPISSISISAWININNWYPPLGIATILNKGGNGPEYWVYLYTQGLVIQLLGVGYFDVPYNFSLNRWYNIATTWDGNMVKIFIDDTIVYSEQITGSITPNEAGLFIGLDNPGVNEYLDGKLDDIRIFNRALSDEEISDLYHEGGWTASGELLAHYQFDGDYQDISGNNNNGNGFNTTFLDDRFNQTGKAVFFNGIDSYMSVPNSASLSSPTQTISISLWFYLEQSFDIHNPFLTKSDDMGQSGQYSLNYCYCDGAPLIDLNIGNTANFIYHNFNLQQWYHLVVTYDGQQVRYYENGNLIGQTPFTGTIEVNSLPLEFGRNMPGLPDYYLGRLDDVRIYNGVLSQSEISDLYHENGWTGDKELNTIVITHGATFDPIPPIPIFSSRWKHYIWQFAMADAVSNNRDIYLIRKGNIYAINASYSDFANINPDSTIEYVINNFGVSRTIDPAKDNVFIFDWTLESGWNLHGYAEAAADVLAATLVKLGTADTFLLNNLHFIGHSRGTVVNSETIERLISWASSGLLPENINLDADIHMTTLDPHPAGHWGKWVWGPGINIKMYDDGANSSNIRQGLSRIGVVGWKSENNYKVTYIDNYYQDWFFSGFIGLSEYPGLNANNLNSNNELTPFFANDVTKAHNLVHTWYHGTINITDLADNFGTGNGIPRSDWYLDGQGLLEGFFYSKNRDGNLNDILSITSELKDVNDDNNYRKEKFIFNGDFSKGFDFVLNPILYPGWSFQGGTISNVNNVLNPSAELSDIQNELIHNILFIPTDAEFLYFRYKVVLPSSVDLLKVNFLNESTTNTVEQPINNFMLNFKWGKVEIPNELKGTACSIGFELTRNDLLPTIVRLDDISFYPSQKIASTVACPVDFNIYDNLGNHTGPINDSTYVEEIPGSEYYIYEDSTGDKIKTVYLEPLGGGGEYIFIIESRDTASYFNYAIEDYSDTSRGTITFMFDSVVVEPNTTAICSLNTNSTTPILEVDLNGDLTIDTTYIPVVITAVENVENQELQLPKEYILSQNYPNPFNPTTTIKYYIPNSVVVKLIIYDLLGKEVKTLVNDFQQRGEHSIKFDGSSLSSGVYFYSLRAGDFMQTKKLILMK